MVIPFTGVWLINRYDLDRSLWHQPISDFNMQWPGQISPPQNETGWTTLIARVVLNDLGRVPTDRIFQVFSLEPPLQHFGESRGREQVRPLAKGLTDRVKIGGHARCRSPILLGQTHVVVDLPRNVDWRRGLFLIGLDLPLHEHGHDLHVLKAHANPDSVLWGLHLAGARMRVTQPERHCAAERADGDPKLVDVELRDRFWHKPRPFSRECPRSPEDYRPGPADPQAHLFLAGPAYRAKPQEADAMLGLARGPCLLTRYEFEQMLGPIQRWT